METYKNKYLKYKNKYLALKKMTGGSRLCSKYTGIKNDIYELLSLLDENCAREELPSQAQDYNRDFEDFEDFEDLDDENPTLDDLYTDFKTSQEKITILRKYISDHGESGDYYSEVRAELNKLLSEDIRP